MLNQDKNFDIINSSDKVENGAKTSCLNLFLPTYSIAVMKISMKQVDYDQLFGMKDFFED
jgi:hypothetical protein